MNNLITLILTFLFLTISCTKKEEPIEEVVDRGLKVATEQALLMAKYLETKEGQLPKSVKNDSLETSGYEWWCSGFFPGELWFIYENSRNEEVKKYAEMYTERVEPAKFLTNTHDLGFMLYYSFGNGYRLTQNPRYKEVLLKGGDILANRFCDKIGVMRSWDFGRNKWQYPVIIDNMMNLEYLEWASKATGDEKYATIARSHSDVTMREHFRPDYSCWHVVSYDTITGKPHIKQTHQGQADSSAWARGQAWALYGYTMMYRESQNRTYLDFAEKIASFIINHPNLPKDKVPFWDFDAPNDAHSPRDASAAAIIASALIELSQFTQGESSNKYRSFAEQQIRSLTSPQYLAETGSNHYFTLMHSTGNKPGGSEIDEPISYADYYYVEALLRLKKLVN